MEFAHIEFLAQFPLGLVFQAHDCERADFIGQGLRWNGDVTLNLCRSIGFAHVAVGEHIFDSLFARPTLAVNAGVHHETHGAEHFVRQCTEALIRVLEQTHIITQGFRIKRPAFDISGVAAKAHERGQFLIFLRDADLEMVARRAFMQIQRRHAGRRAAWQVIGVEIECTRTRTVGRALLIAAASFIFFAEFFVWLDFKRSLGKIFELR